MHEASRYDRRLNNDPRGVRAFAIGQALSISPMSGVIGPDSSVTVHVNFKPLEASSGTSFGDAPSTLVSLRKGKVFGELGKQTGFSLTGSHWW